MEEIVEIILRAVDEASNIFGSVTSSAEEMSDSISSGVEGANSSLGSMESELSQLEQEFQEATTEVERLTQELADIEMGELDGDFDQVAAELAEAEAEAERLSIALDSIDGASVDQTSGSMTELESTTSGADSQVQNLSSDLAIIEASNVLQAAEQIGMLGQQAEMMAQNMNEATITMEQLTIQTGLTNTELTNMVNTITNAAFPQEDALMYIKSLDQMGVSASNFAQAATDIDAINDAFHLGASTANSLAVELGVLGVDLNNVSSAFDALAYANANTAGGMENFYTFLRKFDAEFNQLGINVDQAAIIISAATQKFGGGRAALTGLSDALKESNGDLRVLEQSLGITTGTLDNASAVTGQFKGQLQSMADVEEEHTTILQQLGDAWSDFSLSVGNAIAPVLSVMGVIGQIGAFGLQINGLSNLGSIITATMVKIGLLAETEAGELVIAEGSVVARAASAIGLTTEAAAADVGAASFMGLAIAEDFALWPILAIIAAIALLVVAVYEIGKAFGWWSDVGTMLEAIQDGIRRMWEAFINHPDVQAAIQAISSALSTLWSWIQQAGQAVMNFFGINSSGNFDIVRALIDGIGFAWQAVTLPIHTVINAIQMLWGALDTIYNEGFLPFSEWISDTFAPVFELVGEIINAITPYVQTLTDAFSAFSTGQMDLPNLVLTVMTSLWNIYTTIIGLVLSAVWNWGSQMITAAVNAASNFVNNIVTRISQLPGRVATYLANVLSRIISAGAQWVSSAVSAAANLVSSVVSRLSALPGQISSALAGVVNAITQPFRTAYNTVCGIVDNIKQKVNEALSAAGELVGIGAAGGEMAAGGEGWNNVTPSNDAAKWQPYIDMMMAKYPDFNLAQGGSESKLTVDVNHKLDFNFGDVPAHIDTETLSKAITDKGVLKALTSNSTFQDMDTKIKQMLVAKNNRATGG